MEKENIGIFSVELNTELKKYVIVYIEKGEKIVLEGEEYTFDAFDAANDFINTHNSELNEVVTNYKNALEEETSNSEGKNEDVVADTETEEEKKVIQESEDLEKNKKEKKKKKKKLKKNRRKRKKRNKKDKTKKSGWFVKFVSGFLAAVITLVGGHYIAKGISSAVNNSKPDSSYESSDNINNDKNEDSDLIVIEKPLTTEEFERITTDFTKLYIDKNLNISTEDLVKFVSIVNIDKLVEDNPELASQLFDSQSKEEYLNDAAKVIGLTYTYNRNIYQETGKTDGFIRISNAVSGNQKYALQMIETYVDLIAAHSYDAEQANLYITSLINDLGDPTSELSYLDDGVGFAMQVYIELIRSCIAKDIISQKNLDVLTVLTSSEGYVSNIFIVYDKCNTSYTKTR